MFEGKQYENIFEITKKVPTTKGKTKNQKVVMIRLYDPLTKLSSFHDVTNYSIPDVYISEGKKTKYKSYLDSNITLTKYSFSDQTKYKKFIKEIKKDVLDENGDVLTKIIDFEGEDIEIEISEFEDTAFGYQNFQHTFIHRYFQDHNANDHIHRTWFLDIETRSMHQFQGFPSGAIAPEEVTMIQIYDNFTEQYIILGRKDFTGTFDKKLNAKFIKIEKESNMLEFFIKLLEKHQPSIVSGWNSMTFDMPYLTNRIARVLDGYEGDFYNDYKEDLNHKNSYIDMPNVLRLSPVGVVEGVPSKVTKDGMDGTDVRWKGILLVDYRELTIKHGFLGLPSYALKAVARHFDLSQKVDNSQYKKFDNFYTGDGWIEPKPEELDMTDLVTEYQMGFKEGKYTKEELTQVVYDRFVDYSLRDVEILVELDDITKYMDSHKAIAYECSVSMDDNWGTQKNWHSMLYREAFSHGLVMPLKPQYDKKEEVFVGGLVRTMPGHYDCITSFDFTSLYPSLIRAFNIGPDALVKDFELPQDLIDLRKKYFSSHFNLKKLNKNAYPYEDEFSNPVEVPMGEYVVKYGEKFTNDLLEEGEYYCNILENSDEISTVLKKHNVTVTPNGNFYKKDKQTIFADRMKFIFNERVKNKKAGQKMEGTIEDMKRANASETEIKEAITKKEFFENKSQVLKILINAAFGAASLESAPFGNGKVTGSSITTSGRFCNRSAALACNDYIRGVLGETITEENKAVLNHVPQIDTDSFYLDLTSIFKLPKFKELPDEKKTQIALKLSQGKLQEVINACIDKISNTMNLFEPEALAMENEVITGSFISLAPKRYFCDVKVNDGDILSKPKQKIVGVSLVSYSTPPMLKGMLKPVIDIALDGGEKQLREYIKEQRKVFAKSDPKDFVRKAKVNNLNYKKIGLKYKRQKEDGKWLTAPMGSVSSLEYNRLIEQLDLVGRYDLIEKGDSISYVYTRMPNKYNLLGSVAFTDDRFSEEINLIDIADYEIHWQKDFINKIKIIVAPLNWDIETRTPRGDFAKW